jgi:MFS family permease
LKSNNHAFHFTYLQFGTSAMIPMDDTTPLLPRPTSVSSRRSDSLISDALRNAIDSQDQLEVRRDEEETLEAASADTSNADSVSIGRIVCVLLLGTFISNADGSLLYATHPIIASEFNALHDSTWLIASFALAQAVTQPLYGKLSDIYGRKMMLLLAYTLFATGMALTGSGQSMLVLIIGRVTSGAGSSGMTSLVSILITDLVPLRDVATWRSYVNVVATTGRSVGGPLGGWMADTVGWRWSFVGQVPLAGIATILIATALPSNSREYVESETQQSKLARIDFMGAIFMTLSILGLLLPLEVGGEQVPWSSPIIAVLFVGAIVFGLLFLATEAWVVKEPIIPLILLRQRDVVVSSFIMLLQCSAQTSLMFAVPLYFQVTSNISNGIAGAHLVPAVVGNALGGIISGTIIRRTGRYKLLVVVATLVASTGFALLVVRWHGSTNWLESLYIFPCGFAMGTLQSALFISVQAGIDPSFSAISASLLYLAQPTGNVAGLAVASAVLQGTLKQGLSQRLAEMGIQGETQLRIIKHASSDVRYIDTVEAPIAKAIVASYIKALTWTHGKAILFSPR